MPTILWLRRDLRLADHPALLAAATQAATEGDGRVVPLFVFDDALWRPAGPTRRAWLLRSLARLDADIRARGGDGVLIRYGDPRQVLPAVAAAEGANAVHVSADFAPYGRQRDEAVEQALAADHIDWVPTGSPYAVGPGRVTKADASAYRVFTPFFRAWQAHGWRAPAPDPDPWPSLSWVSGPADAPPPEPDDVPDLPEVGETAAAQRWEEFRTDGLAEYREHRDRPDLRGTSGLSAHLRWGEIHPRTLLADLDDSRGAAVFRSELAWREFYADVLTRWPHSARADLDPRWADMPYDSGPDADTRFDAWTRGATGYPMVDAGMRQLREIGWVHNRVRMLVASFLVKDLHLPWQRGAAVFMRWLRDGDLASNAHGWQWTAGSGTDAAPYFRVFNPVTQGLRYDPNGDYVRAYVPELRHLSGAAVHEPWRWPDGYAHGYPDRIADHAAERTESLRRLATLS